MVSDGLQTNDLTHATSSVGPTMAAIPDSSLVIGFAGPEGDFKGIVDEARRLPSVDWDTFEMDVREIVDNLNEPPNQSPRPCKLQVTVVVAGWIGEVKGIFDSVGYPREALRRRYAFAGSGGILASAAKALATRYCAEEVVSEDLLKTIVDARAQADDNSGKPIWRIDLDRPIKRAYVWLQ
jgi:hypothetical protein